MDELSDFVSIIHDFDIVALSETHLGPTISDNSVNMGNYKLFRNNRNRQGGGVCLFIKEFLSPIRIHDFDSDNLESVWTEVSLGKHKHLFGCIYRPPGQSAAEIQLFLDA